MVKLHKGYFIVFDGIDGCGKSTQLERAAEALQEMGLQVVTLREPTDSRWGREIRQRKMSGGERLSPEQELQYFIEDRKENIENHIKPALAEHAVVLQDRYFYSTVAYQGARGFDARALMELHESFIITPDLTCIFDIKPAESLRRIRNSGSRAPDHFEKAEYLGRVKAIYDTFRAPHIVHVNADRSIDVIHSEIKTLMFSLLKIETGV